MHARAFLFSCLLAGCGSAAATANSGSLTPATRGGPQPPAPRAQFSRELGRDATFADLVRTARAALRSGQRDSSAGCLLGVSSLGYTLEADLMPALDELPDAPTELDVQLQAATGPIRVLSAWGQIGDDDPALVLAAFTALDPARVRAPGIALLVTDEGVYLRYSDGVANAADGPLTPAAAIERVLAAPHNEGATLYLSAEAASPLAQLVELLRALPAERALSLCSILPRGTHVGAPNAIAVERCPDGLPPPEETRPEGDLDSRVILAALAPLRSEAQRCIEGTAGAARAGGKLTLGLRIAGSGEVETACVERDAIGSAALAACVLESARKLKFPAPAPPGFVDARLPLVLSAAASGVAQRALCNATSAAP